MKDILSEYSDPRLPRQVQLRRMRHVIEHELTPLQREVVTAVYLQGRMQKDVAAERGVSCASICRVLRRRRTACGNICGIDF